MSQDRFRVVVDGDGVAEREDPPPAPDGRAVRGPSRLRPKRVLPTERMKFDTQTAALRAFVTASDRGQEAVGAADIAPRIGVSPDTAALVNSFFVEAGFLTKEGKGKYKPVAAVVEYARLHSLKPTEAAMQLRAPLRESWYFKEVARELQIASQPADVLINILARASDTGAERRSQLELILSWLAYAHLIDLGPNGSATLAVAAPIAEDEPNENDPDPGTPDGDSKGEKPTNTGGRLAPEAQVIGFSFDFKLTASDLAKLSSDQITALFKAVGEVIAIKAECEK